jgi:hypothetical protein
MGGLDYGTPAGEATRIDNTRCTTLPKADLLGHFGKIPIKTYKKPAKIRLSSVSLNDEMNIEHADETLDEVNIHLPNR